MTPADHGNSSSPLPSIILVLLMSVGAFWVQKMPLPSARPSEASVAPERYAAQQNIDARLWQDPFEAVKKATSKSDLSIEAANKAALQQPLNTTTPDLCGAIPSADPVRIMAVMVNGAPYAEAAETRRRARYAVVSGLGRSGYVPLDREHLGRMTAAIQAPTSQPQSVVVPFEWFQHANSTDKPALVLWINETLIRDHPLHRVQEIVDQACGREQNRETVIIGPGSSDTLRAMMLEAKRLVISQPSAQQQTGPGASDDFQRFMQGLQIYSPMATEPDERLLQVLDPTQAASGPAPSYCLNPRRTVASALMDKVPGLQFHQTISTDCALVVALTEELRTRGVEPDDGIVLISEWDTAYGRALPKAFDEVLTAKRTQAIDPAKEPLWHYSYLRGLDGILPGDAADKKVDDSKKSREDGAPNIESAFGNQQKDYLRRMAMRVSNLDHSLKARGKRDGVKAIGILGSDVYDKLLILRALHPSFPEAIFFTTDLDARLMQPEEWNSARNLVVASGYGLRLNGWLQREIPPFRDSYQSAYFLSVLAVLMEPGPRKTAMAKVDEWNWRPRVFEIGRSQAVDLSISAQDSQPCDLATCISPHPYITPPAPPPLRVIAALMGFLALAAWYLRRKWVAQLLRAARQDIRASLSQPGRYSQTHFLGYEPAAKPDPWFRKTLRLLACKWVIGSASALLLLGWLGWEAQRIWVDIFVTGTTHGGEPFSWVEGVSSWPSVLLRIFTGLLSVYLLLRGIHRLRQNDVELTDRFFQADRATILARIQPSLGTRICHAFKRGRVCRCLLPGRLLPWFRGEVPEQRRAVLIWRNTIQPRSRAALFGRVVVGVMLLMAAAALLMVLLPSETPNTPIRGEIGVSVHQDTLAFSVLSFIFLLVFVIDSIRRTCRLATRLSGATVWPKDTECAFGCAGSRHCDDWLDIQLIAARTAVVGGFIYYPFVSLSLLILARSSIFDNWQIPIGLGVIFALYLIIALAGAISLRKAAERARSHAVANINHDIIRSLGQDEPKAKIDQMKLMKEAILAEQRGAFSSFLRQPWIKAVLLPLGSYSGIQLLESLSLLNL